MSKITFIITAWGNRRPLALDVLLASLKVQTIPRWRALIVDSDCNAPAHFWKTADERIEYIPQPLGREHKHSEMYKASVKAAELATTEWVAFPNDDCYLCPWFAERMLRKAHDDSADFVYCNMVHGNADRHIYSDNSPCYGHIDKCAFIVKKKVLIAVGGFPEEAYGWYGADGGFAEEVVRGGYKVAKVNDVMVVHN